MDRPQDFGISTGHTGSDPSLQGLEVGQDGRGLENSQQETQDLQPGADVGDVSLCWLLLRRKERRRLDFEFIQFGLQSSTDLKLLELNIPHTGISHKLCDCH